MDSSGVHEIGSGLQLLANSGPSVEINKCSIDNDAAEALANGLHSVVNIEDLDISNNIISPTGAITLLNEVHCLTQLTDLNLSNNNIGCDGAAALAGQLQYLTQLEILYLSHNNIGPRGAVSISHTLCSETVTTLLELELLHCVILLLFLIRFTCFSLVSRNSHQ